MQSQIPQPTDTGAILQRLEQGLERLQEMMADLQKSMYLVLRQSASKYEAEQEGHRKAE